MIEHMGEEQKREVATLRVGDIEIPIEEIRVMHLQSGDAIFVHVARDLSEQELGQILGMCKAMFPENLCSVVSGEVTVEVVRKE